MMLHVPPGLSNGSKFLFQPHSAVTIHYDELLELITFFLGTKTRNVFIKYSERQHNKYI
jgi:hypothetical protein